MNNYKENTWLVTGSLLILAFFTIGMILSYASRVLIPFVFAIFIFALISPMLDFLVIKLKFVRPLAVTVTLLVVLAFISILCLFVIDAIQTLVVTATRYNTSFVNFIERVFAYSTELGLKIDQDKIISDLSGQLPRLAKNAGGTALGFVSGFFFVSIFLIFLLVGRNPNVVKTGIYADIDQKVRKYIGTKVALSAITGILVWISLKFIGLELAGVFGMLAFFLNFIPNIGSIIATFLPIPVAVAQFDTVFPIVFVIMVPGVIQMTVGNVIEPKIMGSGLNLHPIAILLALSFWGLLWGIPGMFLAVPLTAIIRIIMSQFETLKPISDVLAGTLPGTNNSIQPDTLEA